jgi:FAD/FMN-containing dehydrogenase
MSEPTLQQELSAIVGEPYALFDRSEHTRYVNDWFGREGGRARCVLRPRNTAEVAAVVACSARHGVAVVPQGGNTGLVGGALPDDTAAQCVLSLERMTAVRDLDPAGKTITVEAGAVLAHVHAAAREQGMEFPLTMGSQGSATIGGLLSTNAGGTAVLRYGNARALCLGLEVVTPQGEVWNGLRRLRKDNTGYALRDLYIGAEGTLGIITAAVLALVPTPRARLAAMVSVDSPAQAIALLQAVQQRAGALLTAFELISDGCLRLVAQYFPQLPHPFGAAAAPWAVLLELSDHESESHAFELMEGLLGEALDRGLVRDALIPQSLAQSARFWDIREHIPLAQVEDGKNVKHDISLPISAIPRFLQEAGPQLEALHPGVRLIAFGHLGDGNLHFNVAAPAGRPPAEVLDHKSDIHACVHDLVTRLDGSISAEHGIGRMKAAELAHYKSPLELQLFERVKRALDPQGLLNPGKLLLAREP